MSLSPHTASVSSRAVPYAASCGSPFNVISTSSASQVQPEMTPIPLWKDGSRILQEARQEGHLQGVRPGLLPVARHRYHD